MAHRRPDQGYDDRDETASRSPSRAGPSSRHLDPAKRQHLPRLARGSNASVTSSTPRTTVERMNELRQEDARRSRNVERRSGGMSQVSSTLHALPSYYNTSASARAGPLYFQANHQSQQERKEADQRARTRRQFAGPVIASWRSGEERAERQHSSNALSSSSSSSSSSSERRLRWRSTLAARKYIGGYQGERLMSLCDTALSRIAKMLCTADLYDQEIPKGRTLGQPADLAIPLHLKERMLALTGRRQLCKSMNETGLRRLFLAEKRGSGDDDLEKSSEESWDVDEHPRGEVSDLLTSLDLSYARCSFRLVEDVLSRSGQMLQLRQLSLAGWGMHNDYNQLNLHSLLLSKDLTRVIGMLGNLEMLSLARTRLYSADQEAAYQAASYTYQSNGDEKTKDTKSFLTQLSKSSLRLTILDLSECAWIIGSELANLEWYSVDQIATRSTIIWPKLRHLILANCTPFVKPGEETTKLEASPSFVGKWHAIHHGASTDSPYMLDHRPGLGKAIFVNDRQLWRQRRHAAYGNQVDAWDLAGEENHPVDDQDATHLTALPRQVSSSSGYPTRCPVSRAHVGPWEWERARLLDAVRGRWGSALRGNVNSDTAQRGGPFIEVYF
ncbi:hypothetical protein CBS101457_003790 [Exobasidium rhododendri]|nr:hypothetical protein CBS101457_003790 [Exobasidium rhododendri]